MLLQHETDFPAKWTMTSRLHSFTPGRAGSGHLTSTGKTALHHPREEGCIIILLLPRTVWEVRSGCKAGRGPWELGSCRSQGSNGVQCRYGCCWEVTASLTHPRALSKAAGATGDRLAGRQPKAMGFFACRAVYWSHQLSSPTSGFGSKVGTEEDGSDSSSFLSGQNRCICGGGGTWGKFLAPLNTVVDFPIVPAGLVFRKTCGKGLYKTTLACWWKRDEQGRLFWFSPAHSALFLIAKFMQTTQRNMYQTTQMKGYF